MEEAKLTASDGAAGDRFGSFSLKAAGDTAVIGVRLDDDNGSDSGSAYVFVPEPDPTLLLVSGIGGLIVLHRIRRLRVR